MDEHKIKCIVEAALLAADGPLSPRQLQTLFTLGELDRDEARRLIGEALKAIEAEAEGRGYELKRVASGYRLQVRQEFSPWVSRLWEEKPPRYSRALLETLALIAYRQPVTRGDIEEVRGVSVSQTIMRTLLERGWIKVVGQRETPGHPALYGTTSAFLDYFNLRSLSELPPLEEIRSLIEPIVAEEIQTEGLDQEREDPDGENPDTRETDAAVSDGGEFEAADGQTDTQTHEETHPESDPDGTAVDEGARVSAAEAAAAQAGDTVDDAALERALLEAEVVLDETASVVERASATIEPDTTDDESGDSAKHLAEVVPLPRPS